MNAVRSQRDALSAKDTLDLVRRVLNGEVVREASEKVEREHDANSPEARRQAKARAIAEQKQREKERREAAEAAKWRTWTDSTGKKIEAKYSGVISGTVRLVKEDGSAIKIPLEELSEGDQDWIKSRKR
jgi:hypothetical protein